MVAYFDFCGGKPQQVWQQRKFKTTQLYKGFSIPSLSQTVLSAAQLRKQFAETFAFYILLPATWSKDTAEQRAHPATMWRSRVNMTQSGMEAALNLTQPLHCPILHFLYF